MNHEGEHKVNEYQLEEQEPTKKIVNDNNADVMENDKSADVIGGSAVGESSSSRIIPQECVKKARQHRDKLDEFSAEALTLINQTWKDDLASGRLLVSLSELFGESIFPFIPMPEMSIFL